jgi:hypothetical protein
VAWLLQNYAGVRWYAPGPGGENVPARTAWSLPRLDIERAPAYVSREIYATGATQGTDWARHNGLRSRLEFNHALLGVFPPSILAAHPDWAPLLRGRRYPPASDKDYNWQPNLALPEVAEHAAAAAAAAFARDPGRASFSLGMNDTVRFDEGAASLALLLPLRYFRGMPDYSPLVFTFMNRAAEAAARSSPGHYLGCLAYFWCEDVPSFSVSPQVVPYVTTDRAQYYDAAYRAADLDLMSRWGRSGIRAFGLWEYGYGQGFLIPRVPHRALAEAVREGWRRGARGYMADAEPHWGLDTFKLWLLTQLLWTPDRPLADLADDFYAGYYGAAAAPMREFFDRCEAQWMGQAGPPYWLKFYRQADQALLFPPETCRELRALLVRAKAAATEPQVAARVEQTARAFAVTEAYVAFDATRRRLAALATDSGSPAWREATTLAQDIRALAQTKEELGAACAEARRGEFPAMGQIELAPFIKDDPVPRLLWLAGQADPQAPRRLLIEAGPLAAKANAWWQLARVLANGPVTAAPNLVRNSSFLKSASTGPEPRWLFPDSGALPAGWEWRALPTEHGTLALQDDPADHGRRIFRTEGAWDAQLFQWHRAVPGHVYIATAQLRGRSGPGNDAALFLTFLSAAGQVTGTHHMQSLPKGLTTPWRTAVLADQAPENAAWVGVGIGASRQVAGDWLEAAAVELRSTGAEAEP